MDNHIFDEDGNELWFTNGKLHRNGGPAFISPNGTKIWLQYGKIHRNNGPAMEFPDGRQYWYKDSELD